MLHFLKTAKTLPGLEGTISRIEAVWVKIRRTSERKSGRHAGTQIEPAGGC